MYSITIQTQYMYCTFVHVRHVHQAGVLSAAVLQVHRQALDGALQK